jgi:hypothetical protein
VQEEIGNRLFNVPPEVARLNAEYEIGARGCSDAPTSDIYGTEFGFEVRTSFGNKRRRPPLSVNLIPKLSLKH